MDNENVKERTKAMLEQYLDVTTQKDVCENFLSQLAELHKL